MKEYRDCVYEKDIWIDYKLQAHICTNQKDIGKSCVVENVKVRKLTSGEVALCRQYFSNQIHYDKVWLINDSARALGASYKDTSIVRFPFVFLPRSWRDDFSKEHSALAVVANWLHEMTHVWQFCVGGSQFERGNAEGDFRTYDENKKVFVKNRYAIEWRWIKSFFLHNNEQQGELISQYYMMINSPEFRRARIDRWPLLEFAVEKEFLNSDRGASMLPVQMQRPERDDVLYQSLLDKARIRWGKL
ncbi:hypothetical protein KIF53_01335 [Chromobacterium subtsugae]|uniref:Uncharacterized protein n=1 Tax=Chromobacterium subtsugae TaxID=251747 RepID=A0ABS7F865_9NEIS|nr:MULTISPECIES: hypothetical protein [Chromobacterium]MBW7565193.1 hypothetical protein [Chromobacterium subtsugae]MBW8286279.1 hypothetical protein [Chromobacterium subtsugae]WSE91670.1 hypothetical protein U6115_00095 [Chromobacterium subtsugae]WVH60045.1 hypothetical protein U6151_00095 [Chromobacterium subtsugae]